MRGGIFRAALAVLPAIFAASPVFAQGPAPAAPAAPAPAAPAPSTTTAPMGPIPIEVTPATQPDNALQGRPLTIDQAVQLAVSRNERALIADAEVLVSKAAVEAARVKFLPTLTANGNDTLRPYSVQSDGRTTQPANVATGSIVLSQPLLNASAWPLLRQAQRLLDAQRASSKDAKRVLGYDAAISFCDAMSQSSVLAAASKRLDTSKANLSDTQQRVAAGLNTSNDVTKAQLDLASATQEVAADEGNVQRAYISLAFLMNAPIEGALVTPDALMGAAALPVARPEALIAQAEQTRPDLIAARHSSRAAHLFADEPLLRTIPVIGLQGNVNTSSNTPATGRSVDEYLALTFTWTLYDAGQRYADKHSRDAQANIADLTQATLVRSVANDVLTALATLKSAQDQVKASSDAVTASQKNADETSTLYRQGLDTALDLTDANDSRFEAEVAFASAQLTMALAYLALRQAIGLDPIGTELQ